MANEDASWNTVEAYLQEVEKDSGIPIIVSRYGYHIKEFNGKKYLVASTKDELVNQLSIHYKDRHDKAEIIEKFTGDANPACGGSWPSCIPYNGCSKCKHRYIGNKFFFCECGD